MSGDQFPSPNSQEHLRLQAALRESEILRELAELLASSLDLEHILQVLVKRTTQVCEVERCAVWLLEDERGIFHPKSYHLSTQLLDQQTILAADAVWYRSRLPFDDPVIQRLLSAQGMLHIEDLRSEPGMQHVAETFLVRSTLLVALIREGRPVGMLSLDDPGKTRTFSPELQRLVRAIGQQAAIAIDNARLAQAANERATTLDAIFHAMTEGITVADMQGNVLILNNAASHFLGVPKNSRNHLNNFLRRYPTYTIDGRIIPEDQFPLTRALRGERIRAERFVTRRADGEERVLEVNIAPMFESSEQQIGVVSAFRDVTEPIRAEQRMRQALATMLHVAEAVSGITNIKEILRNVLERTLITLNCQRGSVHLFDEEHQKFTPLLSIGFTQEAEERWLADQQIWLDPTPGQYHGFYHQLLEGHAALINAEQCPHQPNPLNQMMVLAAPIKHNKRVHGLIVLDRSPSIETDNAQAEPLQQERSEFSIWDITVLDGIAQLTGLAVEQAHWQQEALHARTSEAAMREANALKDEFLAITAHEFRTPLTVILAQTQLVGRNLARLMSQEEGNNSETLTKATRNLSIVEDQTRQLTDIVKTFLEVSHLNRGKLTLSLEEVNLAEIAQQVVTQSKATAPTHAFACLLESGNQPYLVKGDSARLQQIMANLVDNAIKYSPLGGPITVRLRRGGADKPVIQVCIEDKGMGVPLDAQSRLFERFYRAPNSIESQTKGIGLGLYIVAQLLQMHGGAIHVESSGVLGEGSRFIFTLPALEKKYEVEQT